MRQAAMVALSILMGLSVPSPAQSQQAGKLGILFEVELAGTAETPCAVVISVAEGSDFRGLRKGDCIFAVDQHRFLKLADLFSYIAKKPVGSVIELLYVKDEAVIAVNGRSKIFLPPSSLKADTKPTPLPPRQASPKFLLITDLMSRQDFIKCSVTAGKNRHSADELYTASLNTDIAMSKLAPKMISEQIVRRNSALKGFVSSVRNACN